MNGKRKIWMSREGTGEGERNTHFYIYTRKRGVWEDQGGPRGQPVGAKGRKMEGTGMEGERVD